MLPVLRALVEQVFGEVGRLTDASHRFDAHAMPLNDRLIVTILRVDVSIVVVNVGSTDAIMVQIDSEEWRLTFTAAPVLRLRNRGGRRLGRSDDGT